MANYTATATMDILTRYMVETLDLTNLIQVPRGFQSFFGNPATGGKTRFSTDAKTVEFDVRDGQQGISTLIHRGIVSQPLNKTMLVGGKFTSFNRAFPLAEEEGIISADQILERAFGESTISTLTRRDRMRELALDIASEMIRRAVRTQEILAAQMVRTGKMDTIIGTSSSNEQIDTKRASAHTMSPSASWATPSTSILTDLDSAITLGIRAGYQIDGVVVGSLIPGYVYNNTEIKAFAGIAGANTSGYEVAYIGENVKVEDKFSRFVANGFVPFARFRTPMGRTITMFTYEGGYVASSTFYPFITTDHAIFFSSAARCDRYFGPPETLPMSEQSRADYADIFGFAPEVTPAPANVGGVGDVIRPDEFFFDVRRASDQKSLIVRCQYAPMYITTDTNAFVYCDTVP